MKVKIIIEIRIIGKGYKESRMLNIIKKNYNEEDDDNDDKNDKKNSQCYL